MTNKVTALASSVVLAGFLVACGGSSSDDSKPNGGGTSLNTGKFVDAPVKGLHYKTATQEGYTNEKGEFKYAFGEKVEFILGKDLSLGEVKAGGLISPYTMANVAVGTDNKKATNIALLLQNLDNNRSDGEVLDLSNFKEVELQKDFNISADTDEVVAKLTTKLADAEFKKNIKATENPSIISAETVKAKMAEDVNKAKQKLDEQKEEDKKNVLKSLAENKEYAFIECNSITGCSTKALMSFPNENTISVKGWLTGSIKQEGDVLKATFKEDGKNKTDDFKIKDFSENIISFGNAYWVPTKLSETFLKNKNNDPGLAPKTKITNFDDLKNIRFKGFHEHDDELSISDMTIKSDGKIDGGMSEEDEASATWENGKIHITGWEDDDGKKEPINDTFEVFKYDLAGVHTTTDELSSESIFDEEDLPNKYRGKAITFTKGHMYCRLLWGICYVDEEAMSEIEAQIFSSSTPSEPYPDPSELSSGFTKAWLKAHPLWTAGMGKHGKYKASMTFAENEVTYAGALSATLPYSVTDDGIIDTDESSLEDANPDQHEYYKFLQIEGHQITVCDGEDLNEIRNCTSGTQLFFTSEAAADAYLNSL